jgi:hypothetical protein
MWTAEETAVPLADLLAQARESRQGVAANAKCEPPAAQCTRALKGKADGLTTPMGLGGCAAA